MGPLTALPFLAVLPIVALFCTLLRRLAHFLHLYAPRALISSHPAHTPSTTSTTTTPAGQPTSLPAPASAVHPKPTWGAGPWTALPTALAARVPIPGFILARTLPRVPWTRLASELPEQELDTSNSSVSKRAREAKSGIELGILPTSALPPPPSALPLASPSLLPASFPPLIPVSPPRAPAPLSAPPYATTFVREQDTGTLVDVSISPSAAGPSSAPLYPNGYPYGSPLVPIPAAGSVARPAQATFFPAPVPQNSRARHAFRPASPAEMLTRLSTTPPPPPHRRSRSLGGVPVRRLSGGSKSSGLRNSFSDTDTDNEHEMESAAVMKRGQERSKEGVLIDVSPSPSSSLEEGGESATSTTSRDITLVVPALQKRVRAPLKPLVEDGIRTRNIEMKILISGSASTSARETTSPVGMLVDVGDSDAGPDREQKLEDANTEESQVDDGAWQWFSPSSASTDPWAGRSMGKMHASSLPPMTLPPVSVWTLPTSTPSSLISDSRVPTSTAVITPLGLVPVKHASQATVAKPKRKLDDFAASLEKGKPADSDDTNEEEEPEHARKRVRGRSTLKAMSNAGVASSSEIYAAPCVDTEVEDGIGHAQDALAAPVQAQSKQEQEDENVTRVSASASVQNWDTTVSGEDPFADPVLDSVHNSVTPSWGQDDMHNWRWNGSAKVDESSVVSADTIIPPTSFDAAEHIDVLETDERQAYVQNQVQAQDPFADPVAADPDVGIEVEGVWQTAARHYQDAPGMDNADVEMGTGSWDMIALEEGAHLEAGMDCRDGDEDRDEQSNSVHEVVDEQKDGSVYAYHDNDGHEAEDKVEAFVDVDNEEEHNLPTLIFTQVKTQTLLASLDEGEDNDLHANANTMAVDDVGTEAKDLHDMEDQPQMVAVMGEVLETEAYPDPDLLPLPDILVPTHVTPALAITTVLLDGEISLPTAPVPLSPVPISPTVSVPYPQPVSQIPTPPASPPPGGAPVRVNRSLAVEGLTGLDLKEKKEKKQDEGEKENAPPARLALPPSISRSPSGSSLSSSGQSTRPAWSRRADDAAPLGLATIIGTGTVRVPLTDASSSTNAQSKAVTVVAVDEDLLTTQAQKETGHVVGDNHEKPALGARAVDGHVPGAFYDSSTVTTSADAAPAATKDLATTSTSSLATTTQTSTATSANKRPNPHTWVLPSPARLAQSSPLELALAMQLRPGLGAGADPAWMVRFLMAVYGWVVVSVAGGF